MTFNKNNIYFYIKNNVNFCNKKNLCVLLKKYNGGNICPKAYSFPNDYQEYVTNCANKKMIFKSNAQRQEGLFVTSNVQNINFLNKEKIIVAQEYIQDCLTYKKHRLAFRIWIVISCHKSEINGYAGSDGLVYYNNNIEPDISSFYGSRDLYDNGFPLTISELEKTRNDKIMNILTDKIKDLMEIIKKDQNKHYINDDGHYNEIFGVDLHLTDDLQAYIIEINRGPGMESHCARDDHIRQQMLSGYIDTMHGHENIFMVKL
jgi:hypothetical protein